MASADKARAGSLRARVAALLLAALASGAGVGTLAAADPAADAIFEDGSTAAGLGFVHFNGMSGELYFAEMMGPGGALVDYDNDGDLDVYLVQGAPLGAGKTPFFPSRYPEPLTDRLYRNDLSYDDDGAVVLRFTDVTAAARIDAVEYGMGVAAGDYDNDGWTDLYLTNFGPNRMLRNNGDGTFTSTTEATGTGEARWSASAAFLDYDRDGWLDLFVVNYVNYRISTHRVCATEAGARDYCGPMAYDPVPDRLFRNRGDGTFEDVTTAAGVGAAFGSGLGVVSADFDGDGRQDLYVANDDMPNQLWMNQGDGTFRDLALIAGAAVNWEGVSEGSMGVDAGDFDGDGDEDLFMTHLGTETNTLYVNDGGGLFLDRTLGSGLGTGSWRYTAFGTGWLDYDNDGWLDLLTVNGAVHRSKREAAAGGARVSRPEPAPGESSGPKGAGLTFPLDQTNQLFHNLGNGRFEEATERAGEVFRLSEVSRGAAFGDIDNDGDIDALVINNAGPARLLINRLGNAGSWLGLRVTSPAGAPDLGTRAELRAAGGASIWRRSRADGSYASASDPRILAGLGEARSAERLRIFRPGGEVTEWREPPLGRWLVSVRDSARSAQ